jgi:hypothetical protein
MVLSLLSLPYMQCPDVVLPEEIVALLAEAAPKKKNRSNKKKGPKAAEGAMDTA